MASINSVVLVGNLTRDPELRTIPSGTSVCDLGIAVDERYKSGDEWKSRPNFFQVTVWGRQAETAAEYLEKGREVAIAGRLRWESWETEDGQKRSKVTVTADSVQFIGGRGNGDGGSGGSRGFEAEPDAVPGDEADLPPSGGADAPPSGADDDIPF